MFQAANEEYRQKFARQASTQSTISRTVPSDELRPGLQRSLQPSSASSMNSMKMLQGTGRSSAGVKRTASGLAKAFQSSFDDHPGSQNMPIAINDISPKAAKAAVPEFSENDFDSDIDLDVEEPLAKSAVAYPRLPSSPSTRSTAQTVTYPSMSQHSQLQNVSSKPSGTPVRDRAHRPADTPLAGHAPESSAPVPWSSSPVEHLAASRPHTSLQQFAFGRQGNAAASAQAVPQQQPAKRRVLPWLEEDDEAEPSVISQGRSNVQRADVTPAVKDRKPTSLPWNTTSSAVKDQFKKHREEAKKVSKRSETDEQIVEKAASGRKRPAKVFLSEEQKHVLDLVVEQKKSVFFTGSAGTGKSVLMREIIKSMKQKYIREPDRVAVTASTGLAACNVGGVTLHSFAGIGLGKEDVPELVRKIKRNQKAKHRWIRTKVLVVDEISMVDGELFDKLEAIARQIRNNARPFGGIQLVITGDFFQLPPVPDSNRIAKFAFDAGTWRTSVEHTICLHHVFRQKDPVFAGMLNEMREGRLSESSIKAFRNLSRPLNFDDSLDATELFPTRMEVERANGQKLDHLQGQHFPFHARDGGSITDKAQRDKLLQNCMAPETIILKKGAQVMLIKNIDETLVNGSIGRVLGFMDEREFDSYTNDEAAYLASLGPDEPPTLSAATDHDAGFRRQALNTLTTSRRFPIVRFELADGTQRELLCQPESWKVELPNGEVQASRAQIPLILAYALSIHKAQGQTLSRVKVDLGKVFEKGQAYVALSRATSMAGLQVLRFDPRKVIAHEKVKGFYANLSRVESLDGGGPLPAAAPKKPALGLADAYERRFVDGSL